MYVSSIHNKLANYKSSGHVLNLYIVTTSCNAMHHLLQYHATVMKLDHMLRTYSYSYVVTIIFILVSYHNLTT